MKQRIVSVLRALRLLHAADWGRYRLDEWRQRRENERFRAENPAIALPPLDFLYEISGSASLRRYWHDGRRLADSLWRLMAPHLPRSNVAVCEWGCGIGRIIRHLPGAGEGRITRIAGMDYNARMVAWCRQAIPGIEFRQNALLPPSPFGDAEFDAAYCCSVFTHLSESNYHAWLAELFRIVKPGGVVAFTTLSESSKLLPDERQAFDSGRLVVRESKREGERVFVSYASPQFIQKLLGERPILAHVPATESGVGQDSWVVRATQCAGSAD